MLSETLAEIVTKPEMIELFLGDVMEIDGRDVSAA